jgi:hypothetical protein
MDLCLAYNMEEDTMESIQIEYLNLIAAYMLHALAWSSETRCPVLRQGTMESIQIEYLSLIAAYMLHALALSSETVSEHG